MSKRIFGQKSRETGVRRLGVESDAAFNKVSVDLDSSLSLSSLFISLTLSFFFHSLLPLYATPLSFCSEWGSKLRGYFVSCPTSLKLGPGFPPRAWNVHACVCVSDCELCIAGVFKSGFNFFLLFLEQGMDSFFLLLQGIVIVLVLTPMRTHTVTVKRNGYILGLDNG